MKPNPTVWCRLQAVPFSGFILVSILALASGEDCPKGNFKAIAKNTIKNGYFMATVQISKFRFGMESQIQWNWSGI